MDFFDFDGPACLPFGAKKRRRVSETEAPEGWPRNSHEIALSNNGGYLSQHSPLNPGPSQLASIRTTPSAPLPIATQYLLKASRASRRIVSVQSAPEPSTRTRVHPALPAFRRDHLNLEVLSAEELAALSSQLDEDEVLVKRLMTAHRAQFLARSRLQPSSFAGHQSQAPEDCTNDLGPTVEARPDHDHVVAAATATAPASAPVPPAQDPARPHHSPVPPAPAPAPAPAAHAPSSQHMLFNKLCVQRAIYDDGEGLAAAFSPRRPASAPMAATVSSTEPAATAANANGRVTAAATATAARGASSSSQPDGSSPRHVSRSGDSSLPSPPPPPPPPPPSQRRPPCGARPPPPPPPQHPVWQRGVSSAAGAGAAGAATPASDAATTGAATFPRDGAPLAFRAPPVEWAAAQKRERLVRDGEPSDESSVSSLRHKGYAARTPRSMAHLLPPPPLAHPPPATPVQAAYPGGEVGATAAATAVIAAATAAAAAFGYGSFRQRGVAAAASSAAAAAQARKEAGTERSYPEAPRRVPPDDLAAAAAVAPQVLEALRPDNRAGWCWLPEEAEAAARAMAGGGGVSGWPPGLRAHLAAGSVCGGGRGGGRGVRAGKTS